MGVLLPAQYRELYAARAKSAEIQILLKCNMIDDFVSDVLEKGDIYHDLHMSGCV